MANLSFGISLQTPERDFTIKISGLEIYNENVRDLLNSESGRSLKLLDDPEVIFKFFAFSNKWAHKSLPCPEFGISYFNILLWLCFEVSFFL